MKSCTSHRLANWAFWKIDRLACWEWRAVATVWLEQKLQFEVSQQTSLSCDPSSNSGWDSSTWPRFTHSIAILSFLEAQSSTRWTFQRASALNFWMQKFRSIQLTSHQMANAFSWVGCRLMEDTTFIRCSNCNWTISGDQQGGLGMFRTDANLSNLTKVRRFLIAPNIRISNISVCSIEKSFYVLVSTNESLMLFAVTGMGQTDLEVDHFCRFLKTPILTPYKNLQTRLLSKWLIAGRFEPKPSRLSQSVRWVKTSTRFSTFAPSFAHCLSFTIKRKICRLFLAQKAAQCYFSRQNVINRLMLFRKSDYTFRYCRMLNWKSRRLSMYGT